LDLGARRFRGNMDMTTKKHQAHNSLFRGSRMEDKVMDLSVQWW